MSDVSIDRASIENSAMGATILVIVDGVEQFVEFRRTTILHARSPSGDHGRSSADLLTRDLATFEDAIRSAFSGGRKGPEGSIVMTF